MRLATVVEDGAFRTVVVRDDRVLPIELPSGVRPTMRDLAAGRVAIDEVRAWVDTQASTAGQPLDGVKLGPAVPDPGAVFTVGLNYDGPGAAPRPERPLIYGKAATSVAGHGATLAWDRSVTDDVDAEVELGICIGPGPAVFGYTVIDDISARDEHLDGDQWLLGKSMPGFCPVGPWIVTADEIEPDDLALECTINGAAIQEGRTSQMRFTVGEIVAYLGRHLALRPGDLIATGTPVRLQEPPGPGRRLRPGDEVTVRIQGIGELTTIIA